MTTVVRDPIWHQNVSVMWKRWADFFPKATQTTAERINSVVRFIAYATVFIFAFNRKTKYIVFGFASLVMITLAFDLKFVTSAEDLFELGKARCVRPTVNNPFGNYMRFDDPGRAAACPNDTVSDETRNAFNNGLIRNVEDIYERENSQRQFYSMPVTQSLPNTRAFAEFLYGHGPTCKEKSYACTGR